MTYGDINSYLSAFGVNTKKGTSGVNSKWVYSKELLADASDELLLRIADELDIAHGYTSNPSLPESQFWLEGHFRLFLSHVSAVRESASHLQDALKAYAISSFVAHKDIEPTAEWQDEIEKALLSMHGLGAIMSPEFRQSAWCDQEIGVAFGRGILIVPVMRGSEPHGFIGKFQEINAQGKTVAEVAESMFRVLASHPKTKFNLANALIHQVLYAGDEPKALHFLSLLRRAGKPPQDILEKLRENVRDRELLTSSTKILNQLNQLLAEYGLAAVEPAAAEMEFDDDIPF